MHLTKTVVGVGHRSVRPDSLWGVCPIERVEDPARARRCHRNEPMRRATRKMMHEGAVRVMAEGASGRVLPEEWSCKTHRRKAEEGRLKEYTGFSLTGRKLSEAGQTPWQRACDEGHGEDED